MIDFRYHIVSLIAVFLALGIGVVMGTTVVDQAIVRRQSKLLKTLDSEVTSERNQRRDAQQQLDAFNRFTTQGAKFFVGDRLAGKTVTIVTAGGVQKEWVDGAVQIERSAGAVVPAVVSMTSKWQLKEQTARDQLALFTGAPPQSDAATLRKWAIVDLGAKLANAQPAPDQVALFNPDKAATIMKNLSDNGFILIAGVDVQQNLDPNSLGTAPGSMVTLVGANDMQPPLADFFVPLTTQFALGKVAVATQGQTNPPAKQVYMDAIRASKAPQTMTTVDNVNTQIGLIATVVGLQQMQNGIFEQLGTGAGSQGLLPSRTG